jgi:hypothetical protein
MCVCVFFVVVSGGHCSQRFRWTPSSSSSPPHFYFNHGIAEAPHLPLSLPSLATRPSEPPTPSLAILLINHGPVVPLCGLPSGRRLNPNHKQLLVPPRPDPLQSNLQQSSLQPNSTALYVTQSPPQVEGTISASTDSSVVLASVYAPPLDGASFSSATEGLARGLAGLMFDPTRVNGVQPA